MDKQKELLDYCRVKKIFDKGFGFLTSLYYDEPVFFHFNKVKDPDAKTKLEKLKRGEVYFFFTSIFHNNKRKVLKLWLDVKDIEKNLIPDFAARVTKELYDGKINIFEIAHVIKLLRENNYIDESNFKNILSSPKMLKTPSLLKAVLLEEELKNIDQINLLVDELETNKITHEVWINSVLKIIPKKT